jgi:hypothetical protein
MSDLFPVFPIADSCSKSAVSGFSMAFLNRMPIQILFGAKPDTLIFVKYSFSAPTSSEIPLDL